MKLEKIILTFQFIQWEVIEMPFSFRIWISNNNFQSNEKSFQITNTKDHVVWRVGNCFENRDRFCFIYMSP